jgi:homogentisate 1,2-dioxygenase
MTSEQLMHEALSIRLGADAQSPERVVSFLYEQLTGAAPTAAERDNFVGWITQGRYSVDGLAVFASELDLNPVAAQLTGMASLGLAYATPL